MSNALAIAAVTSVMRDRIQAALSAHFDEFNDVVGLLPDVTSIAPDLITTGVGEPPSVNLYFFGATPNQGWRNVGLPSHSGDGERLTNRPLALDLHYLLTAYGSADLQAEVLLGYAMQRLHEVPVLDRDTIRATLIGDLEASHLADQIEMVKITPETMSTEEISKMWTAFSASYRPSVVYRASVVLIESDEPVRTALPVLTRGRRGPSPVTGLDVEQGPVVVTGLVPPYPTLTEIRPPDAQPAAQLGETVRLLGHHLDGVGHLVLFEHVRQRVTLEVAPDSVAADEIVVTIPAGAPADWPAGLYSLGVSLTRDGSERTTNALPLALAPTIDAANVLVVTVANTTTLTVPVAPQVRPEQMASLVVGQREVPAEDHPAQTSTLTFEIEDIAPDNYFIRLRVDGIESVLIDRSATPPVFDNTQQVTI